MTTPKKRTKNGKTHQIKWAKVPYYALRWLADEKARVAFLLQASGAKFKRRSRKNNPTDSTINAHQPCVIHSVWLQVAKSPGRVSSSLQRRHTTTNQRYFYISLLRFPPFFFSFSRLSFSTWEPRHTGLRPALRLTAKSRRFTTLPTSSHLEVSHLFSLFFLSTSTVGRGKKKKKKEEEKKSLSESKMLLRVWSIWGKEETEKQPAGLWAVGKEFQFLHCHHMWTNEKSTKYA